MYNKLEKKIGVELDYRCYKDYLTSDQIKIIDKIDGEKNRREKIKKLVKNDSLYEFMGLSDYFFILLPLKNYEKIETLKKYKKIENKKLKVFG